MRIWAYVCFGVALAASLALIPDLEWVIPVFGYSLLRFVAFGVALALWIAAGELDGWGRLRTLWVSRLLWFLLALFGAFLTLYVSAVLQSVRYDELPDAYPPFLLVIARFWPLCLMAGAFWRSRVVYAFAIVGALTSGIYVQLHWDAWHEQYRAEAPLRQTKADDARAREIAPVMNALAAIPASAGVEPLLPFVLETNPNEAYSEAKRRIEATTDMMAQLSRLLDGERALDALVVMIRIWDDTPEKFDDSVQTHAWQTAARLADGLTQRVAAGADTHADEEKLCAVVDALVYRRPKPWTLVERRRSELIRVSDWMNATESRTWVCSVRSRFDLMQELGRAGPESKP